MPHGAPEARFRWLYEQNPEGQAVTWVAVDDASGDIAGVTSYFPMRLWVQGQVLRAAIGGDGFVPPRFRRRGIAAALHRALRAEMPRHGFEVMFGAPAPMNRTPLQQAGSVPITEMVRYLRPLTASALDERARLLDPIARGLLTPRARGVTLDPVTRKDGRVDEVWAAARGGLSIATVRDAAFYDWRFGDAPAKAQEAFVVLERGRPVGTCAWQRRGDRMHVIDVCAPQDKWGTVLDVLAREAGPAQALELSMLREDAARRGLWRRGFIAREGRPYLVVTPEGSSRAGVLRDPALWTYLDADIDLDLFV